MIQLLVAVGRNVIGAAALLTILYFGFIGWGFGIAYDIRAGYINALQEITPNRLIFTLLGLVVGLIVAGATFGVAAAIFDIQRRLASAELSAGTDPHRLSRREPKL